MRSSDSRTTASLFDMLVSLNFRIPFLQSLNRYAYALNNPTTLIDPSGLGSQDACAMYFHLPPNQEHCPFNRVGALGCTLDGIDASCDTVFNSINAGAVKGLDSVTVYGGTIILTGEHSPPPGGPDIPGITWCQNAPLWWFWFAPNMTFGEVLGALEKAGLSRTADVGNHHPGTVEIRNTDPLCGLHIDIDLPQRDVPGEASGDAHLDTINPYSPYSLAILGPLSVPLAHGVVDVWSHQSGRGCSAFPP